MQNFRSLSLYIIITLLYLISSCSTGELEYEKLSKYFTFEDPIEHLEVCDIDFSPIKLVHNFLDEVPNRNVIQELPLKLEDASTLTERQEYFNQYHNYFINKNNIERLKIYSKPEDVIFYMNFFNRDTPEKLLYAEMSFSIASTFGYPKKELIEGKIDYDFTRFLQDLTNEDFKGLLYFDILFFNEILEKGIVNSDIQFESIILGHEQFHKSHYENFFKDIVGIELAKYELKNNEKYVLFLDYYIEIIADYAQLEYQNKFDIYDETILGPENYWMKFTEFTSGYNQKNSDKDLQCIRKNVLLNLFHPILCQMKVETGNMNRKAPAIVNYNEKLYVLTRGFATNPYYFPLPEELKDACSGMLPYKIITTSISGESIPELKNN